LPALVALWKFHIRWQVNVTWKLRPKGPHRERERERERERVFTYDECTSTFIRCKKVKNSMHPGGYFCKLTFWSESILKDLGLVYSRLSEMNRQQGGGVWVFVLDGWEVRSYVIRGEVTFEILLIHMRGIYWGTFNSRGGKNYPILGLL
jgi:hypothetical protein